MWNFNDYHKEYAIIDENGNKWTYADLKMNANKFKKKIRKRKLLVIVADICVETIIGYITAIKYHIPVMMVGSIEHIKNVMEKYTPEYIWCKKEESVFENYRNVYSLYNYCLLKRNKSLKYEICKELALLLPTSGSMGNVKYVKLSRTNIEDNTKAIIRSLNIEKGKRAAVMLPLSYAYGLSIVNTYLYQGGCLLVPKSKIIQKEFWDFLMENNCNAISGVPYTYELLKKINFHKLCMKSLELMTQAGGKIKTDVEKYFLKYSMENNCK